MIQDSVEMYVYRALVSDPRTAAWFGFRVTPVVATQGTTRAADGSVLPFCTFKMIDKSDQNLDLTPFDEQTSQVQAVTISLDIYAETYEQVKPAAAAVRSVLHRATGTAYGATLILSVQKSESDDIAVPTDGKGVPLYAVTQTYELQISASF